MSRRDLLLHPIRLRIVQSLVGRPMAPLALKDQLGDVAQATLYRHLKQLVDGGLIESIDERRVRGGIEHTYAVVEEAVQLTEEDFADASRDEHLRLFTAFVGSLIADFGAYLDKPQPNLAADGVGYQQVPLWLTDEEFAELAGELRDAVRSRFDHDPGPGRTRRLVTSIVMPDGRSTAAGAPSGRG